ncbi:N-terminal glutamine amidase-domain-containing protein [Lentinula lateritia]|uniref:N-terminal glutamine amidase-domain-containing protein n=1 Tax=Lentinula aff. lateritia TaxID=2804960 RepID=A0ACC1UCS0_9AGAR|nr:N-terminal glutamine amidase-domain-containing protein [Lentinula aff. lateritia]KAJ3856330.1 N-terminal glutamine amidase-domain-containing protein [Lentinula lateritia]
MSLKPPDLPQDAAYTSHWCEENVYLLIQSFSRDSSLSEDWDVFAVFISNHSKTASDLNIHFTLQVALWNQKPSEELGYPVIWDYHVVAVLRPRNISTSVQSWVYDFDTRLGIPVTFHTYLLQTFSVNVLDELQSYFRVVSANVFLDRFASDRSHMLAPTSGNLEGPIYLKPVPPYPSIRGAHCTNAHNIMDFVSMLPSDGHGDVFSLQAIDYFFGLKEELKSLPTEEKPASIILDVGHDAFAE